MRGIDILGEMESVQERSKAYAFPKAISFYGDADQHKTKQTLLSLRMLVST